MRMASLLLLSDVDAPKIKMDLPHVRQGEHIKLHFKVERLKNGRSEVLEVSGDFRVSQTEILADTRQEVTVESLGKAPAWRAVKKKPAFSRKMGLARFPRTTVT